jgi:hypothetical protein
MPAASRIRQLFGQTSVLRRSASLLPGRFAYDGPHGLIANGLYGPYLTANADDSQARIRVDLYWPDVDSADVTRTDADAVTTDVRGGDPAVVCTHWARRDYEAPLDQLVFYNVSAAERPGDAYSTGTLSVSGGGRHWLKAPLNPSLNMRVTVHERGNRSLPDRRGVLRPPQRTDPIVVYQLRGQDVGDAMELYAPDQATETAIRALLASGAPLLLQYPAQFGGESLYVSIGAAPVTPRIRLSADRQQIIGIPFDSIGYPPGIAAANTADSYAALSTRWRTYNDMKSSGLTLLELTML